MRWFFAIIVAVLLISPVMALRVPEPTGYLVDQGDMFTPAEEAQLVGLLNYIQQNTTAEIAVLTIPSLEDEDLEMYANRVFREWGIGKSDINNGLLILVSRDDRQVRIEVGYGLEGVITDAVSSQIIRNVIAPAFREEKYAEGVGRAVAEIALLVQDDPSTVSKYGPTTTPTDYGFGGLIFLIFIVAFVTISLRFKKDKKKKKKYLRGSFLGIFVMGFIASVFISSDVIWTVLFICFLVMMFTGNSGGFFFFPGMGGGRMGGGGGFGGFGGGSSGGGGGSGGW